MSAPLRTVSPRRFTKCEDGAIAVWFSLLLVPIMGFTYAAIEYSELAAERAGMIDAMDAAALALARQYEVGGYQPCAIAQATEGDGTAEGDAKAKLIRYGREFFEQSYPEHRYLYRDPNLGAAFDVTQDLTFDFTCSTITAEVAGYSDMGGILAENFGVGAVPLNLSAEISLPGTGSVEIALVLDVTGSMGWDSCPSSTPNCPSAGTSRIDALRTAVSAMLDDPDMFGAAADAEKDNIRMSIVPFASAVNVGADYSGKRIGGSVTDEVGDWMDGWGGKTPKAEYHGAGLFFTRDKNNAFAWTSPNGTEYTYPRLRVQDAKVNHFTLFDSTTDDGAQWKGCVEALPFPLDEGDFEPGVTPDKAFYDDLFVKPDLGVTFTTRMNEAWSQMESDPTGGSGQTADNTLFVPYFNRDAVDCFNGACYWQIGQNSELKAFTPYASLNYTPSVLFRSPGAGGYVYVGRNWDFVPDETFLDPNGGVSEAKDRNRYRSLMLDMHRHGQQRPNLHGGSTTMVDCWSGSIGNPGALPYNRQKPLERLMRRLDITNCYRDEYKLRSAYVGSYSNKDGVYYGKYENADYDETRDDPASHLMPNIGPNDGCGGPILPLTTKKADLVAQLNALTPSGATNTAVGLVWGWRTLSPGAPFVEAADPSTPDGKRWRKYAILMTDGDNTFSSIGSGNSRRSYEMSDYGPYGYAREDRLGILTSEGPDDVSSAFANEMNDKTIRMCHRMLARGIKVYTVGFAIEADSNADKMLAACAVDPDAYFLASNADELTAAFTEITSQVVDLYVSN